jgi:hypothetical protein
MLSIDKVRWRSDRPQILIADAVVGYGAGF